MENEIIKLAESLDKMNTEDRQILKSAIRKLKRENNILSAIPEHKKYYKFLCRYENEIRTIVMLEDFDLIHDDDFGVFHLKNITNNDEEKGSKANRLRFKKRDFLIYCAIFEEWNNEFSSEYYVEIPLENIKLKISSYDTENKFPEINKTEMLSSLDLFKKFNLIRTRKDDDGNIWIKIFPTFIFCLNENELEDYAKSITAKKEDYLED